MSDQDEISQTNGTDPANPVSHGDVPHGEVSYGDAITEVENILAELETNVVDVDHLADRVRRASELLALCRDRLAVVEVDVGSLVAQLDFPDDDPGADGHSTTASDGGGGGNAEGP